MAILYRLDCQVLCSKIAHSQNSSPGCQNSPPELRNSPLDIENQRGYFGILGSYFAIQRSYFARGLFCCTELDGLNGTLVFIHPLIIMKYKLFMGLIFDLASPYSDWFEGNFTGLDCSHYWPKPGLSLGINQPLTVGLQWPKILNGNCKKYSKG